ncbi:NitT/TauT family transport system permease protein [Devosia enhydra]|uniref:NitT/TauT family transport system permease protein n=1 Tax=Devosia enhydra TaxID=665118 RepID=A0A1K2HXY8_9HYPH|nr:ABC transporter permease [Devosia enhydra]SFZ84587.1 NitT/TauT family transport system permease protein [Devosia enhydra]
MSTPDTARSDTVWVEHVALIDRIPRSLGMAALLVGFVLAWQLLCMSGAVPAILLPTPAETGADLLFVGQNLLSGGYVLKAAATTASEMLLGFAIATSLGIALGILVGETRFGERAVMPYLVAIDTMPKIAFAPLFVAWLGFGIASKVALAAFMATFPVVVATAAGLAAVDANAQMLFRSMGASRLKTLTRLKLPIALPYFFAGLKIAAVSVTAGAIAGEFMGGGEGMGQLIRVAAGQLATARVFSLIFYLSLFGLTLFVLVGWIERKVVFWRR